MGLSAGSDKEQIQVIQKLAQNFIACTFCHRFFYVIAAAFTKQSIKLGHILMILALVGEAIPVVQQNLIIDDAIFKLKRQTRRVCCIVPIWYQFVGEMIFFAPAASVNTAGSEVRMIKERYCSTYSRLYFLRSFTQSIRTPASASVYKLPRNSLKSVATERFISFSVPSISVWIMPIKSA